MIHCKELHRKETNNIVCTPSEGSEGSDQLKSPQNGTDALAVHVKNVISPWVCNESNVMV